MKRAAPPFIREPIAEESYTQQITSRVKSDWALCEVFPGRRASKAKPKTETEHCCRERQCVESFVPQVASRLGVRIQARRRPRDAQPPRSALASPLRGCAGNIAACTPRRLGAFFNSRGRALAILPRPSLPPRPMLPRRRPRRPAMLLREALLGSTTLRQATFARRRARRLRPLGPCRRTQIGWTPCAKRSQRLILRDRTTRCGSSSRCTRRGWSSTT